MEKKHLASTIIIVLVCTIFASVGQLFLKLGADNLELSLTGLISNIFLIMGVITYGIGALIFVLALKKGDLSVVYPFISLSFIWVAILSLIFLGESIVLLQWLGLIIIVIGVSFVGWGAKSA